MQKGDENDQNRCKINQFHARFEAIFERYAESRDTMPIICLAATHPDDGECKRLRINRLMQPATASPQGPGAIRISVTS